MNMKEKIIKKSPKWRPKRKWIESTTIDLKTGKSKHKYFVPKTPEEEKKLEDDYNEKMKQVLDILFPNGI